MSARRKHTSTLCIIFDIFKPFSTCHAACMIWTCAMQFKGGTRNIATPESVLTGVATDMTQGDNGTDSATCQNSFNLLTCAASCMCGLPAPPFRASSAPGCGYNTSLFSQQSRPGPGCSCCDAGFDYEDSCAAQVRFEQSSCFKACVLPAAKHLHPGPHVSQQLIACLDL